MSKELGARVRTQRSRRGLSQNELAQRAGVSPGYVSLIENGQREPSPKALNSFASALGTTSDFLRTGMVPSSQDDLTPEPLRLARVAWDAGDTQGAKHILLDLDLQNAAPAYRFQGLSLLGRAHDTLGETEEAIELLEQAVELGRVAALPRDYAEAGMSLIAALVDSGGLRRAVDVGDTILGELAAVDEVVGSDEHLRLGSTVVWAIFELGDYEHANFRANALVQVAESLGSPWGQASVYWNTALIKQARGEDAEGLRLIEQTLDAMLAVGSKRDVPRVRLDYALMLLNGAAPRAEEARTQLELAADGLRLYGTTSERARCSFAQARAALLMDELQVAEDLATYGLVSLGKAVNLDACEGHLVLGDLAARRGQRTATDQRYRAAGDQLAQMDISRRSGSSWGSLAQRLVSAGDSLRAMQAYNEALHALQVLPLVSGSEVVATQAHAGWGGRRL